MPIVENVSGKYHQGGVSQLQYVGGVDDPSFGSWDESPIGSAVKFGLLLMGVSCLLGVKPSTSRWIGVAGVGLGLAKKGWE